MHNSKKTFLTIFWLSSFVGGYSSEQKGLFPEKENGEATFEPVQLLLPTLEEAEGIPLLDKRFEKIDISVDGTPIKKEEVLLPSWSLTFYSGIYEGNKREQPIKRHQFFSSKNFIPFQIQKTTHPPFFPSLSPIEKRSLSSQFCKLSSMANVEDYSPIEKEPVFVYESFSPLEEEEFEDIFVLGLNKKTENTSLRNFHLCLLPHLEKNELKSEAHTPGRAILREINPKLLPIKISNEGNDLKTSKAEALSSNSFVEEKEVHYKNKPISFRIAKNFQCHFWIELDQKDVKDDPLELKKECYSYLASDTYPLEPIYLGDRCKETNAKFLEGPKIAQSLENSPTANSNFEPVTVSTQKKIASLKKSDFPSSIALKMDSEKKGKIENYVLDSQMHRWTATNSKIHQPPLFSSSLERIKDNTTVLVATNTALNESWDDEKGVSLSQIPQILLSLAVEHGAKVGGLLFPNKDSNSPFFFSKYLEPSDKTVFHWARFKIHLLLNPIVQPIHAFYEYVVDLVQPFEEKIENFFLFLISKFPVENTLKASLATPPAQTSLQQYSTLDEKPKLFSKYVLSLPLPQILRTFCNDLQAHKASASPVSVAFDEQQAEEKNLEISEKLENPVIPFNSKFVVFHHPVSAPKVSIVHVEEKENLDLKATELDKELKLSLHEPNEALPETIHEEYPLTYLPFKVKDVKNPLNVFYSSGIFLTHVNILHPGFIKISTQKEALLKLFDAKKETLIADKDRLDFLPGQKFRSSIQLEHTKTVCFEPVPNDFDEKIWIEKIDIVTLDSPQKKILKNFQNSDLTLIQIPAISGSLSAVTGARLLNEQLQKLFYSIDSFNKVAYLCEDVSHQFSTKASSAALSSKEGYGMEIELELHESYRPCILDQEIIFVIDGSKNTPLEHYDLYKVAILRSLKSLNTDTCFNIISVGKTVEKLFENPVNVSQDKQILAKRFLEKTISSQSIQTGLLLQTCSKLMPKQDDSKLTSVVVLADSIKPQKQLIYLEEVKKIVAKKPGNFQLITTSITPKDLQELKFISMIGAGQNHIFPTESSFVRKFCSMIRKIKFPYLANLTITSLTEGVELLPQNQLISPIFINQPLKFYAVSEKNCPFILLVQGMCDGKIVHIRKEINPVTNESIRAKMKAEIQLKRAADAFEEYVKKQNRTHLDDLNRHLELFDLKL
ncbi:MAG: hypothetical protein FJZ62_02130 [Chlamydiae bacterium]|nr:hypothetical protein [Chlamydiota bacterium]